MTELLQSLLELDLVMWSHGGPFLRQLLESFSHLGSFFDSRLPFDAFMAFNGFLEEESVGRRGRHIARHLLQKILDFLVVFDGTTSQASPNQTGVIVQCNIG